MEIIHLRILRKIASSQIPIALNSAFDVVSFALLLEADPSADYNEAFRLASDNGHTEIVRLLLELPLDRCVNPAARDNYAIRLASDNGHTEIVRLLLELPLDRGVNPAANNNEALWHASLKGQMEIVRMLLQLPLERGVNPKECSVPPSGGICRRFLV